MSIRLAAILCAACVAAGAVLHAGVQPLLPGSPQKRLAAKEKALSVMTAAQRDAAASSWLWYGNYQRLHISAAQQHQAASTALSEASRQCRANSDRSYQSGVLAGRAIERNRHATSQPDLGTDPAHDDSGVQFDQLWDTASAERGGQD